jgi:hypothetical protein
MVLVEEKTRVLLARRSEERYAPPAWTERRAVWVVQTLKEELQCNLLSVTPATNTVVPQAKG